MLDETMREAVNHSLAGATYNELVAAMIQAQEEHTRAKAASSEAWDMVCHIARSVIPNRMDADQIQNITVILPDGIKKQLLILDKVSVKTPPENKAALWEWLREHDAEALISETVNSSTLSAFVTQQMKAGDEYPVDILDVSTYSTASLRKAS